MALLEPESVEDKVVGLMFEPAAGLVGRVLLLGGPQARWLVIRRTIDKAVAYAYIAAKEGKKLFQYNEDTIEAGISYLRDHGLAEGDKLLKLTPSGFAVLKEACGMYLALTGFKPHRSY